MSEREFWRTTTPSVTGIRRRWFFIDLKGKILGRAASLAADILRGKKKSDFSYNVDLGDYLVAVNAKSVKLTGKNKPIKKIYYNHSGYIGGLRSRSTKEMVNRYPEELLRRVVKGMLPKNKLARKQLGRLFVFAGEKHNLIAQQKMFTKL